MKRAVYHVLLASALVLGCTDDEHSSTDYERSEKLANDGVRQYLQDYCDCYYQVLDFDSQETCIDVLFARYPFTDCDQQALILDEENASSFFECLQRNANRAAACLIKATSSTGTGQCESSLVLTCEETFETLERGTCEERLNETQRQALLLCAQQ